MANEIEISHNEPGPEDPRRDREHVLNETIGERVIRGGINVSESDGHPRGGARESDGDKVSRLEGGDEREGRGIPRGDYAATAPVRVFGGKLREVMGEERHGFTSV